MTYETREAEGTNTKVPTLPLVQGAQTCALLDYEKIEHI